MGGGERGAVGSGCSPRGCPGGGALGSQVGDEKEDKEETVPAGRWDLIRPPSVTFFCFIFKSETVVIIRKGPGGKPGVGPWEGLGVGWGL